MFDIKKIFAPNVTFSRLEFFKVIISILIFPCLAYILLILIPSNAFLYLVVLALIIFYLIMNWISIYRRLKNIFDNKKITIISFILCFLATFIPSDKLLGLNISPLSDNLLIQAIIFIALISVPGKKESDKVISNKSFYLLSFVMILVCLFFKFGGLQYYIVGKGMADILQPNDKIFVNIFEKNYKRGDIIIYKSEESTQVRRIIALPNEKFEIKQNKNGENAIYINDKLLDEPYILNSKNWSKCNKNMFCGPLTTPSDSYFIMGDNRENSKDSRYYGMVNKDMLKGRVMRIFFPFDRVIEFGRK